MPENIEIRYKFNYGGSDYIYKVINKNTIKEISNSEKIQLPHRELDIKKDQLWNAKKVNSELLQAIKSGESIDKMYGRFMNVTDMNRNSAIRNARTMTTSFENLGRIDSMKELENQGVIIEKEWSATHDGKTRNAHQDLDGQKAEVNEPFKSILGDIMYPGDMSADPANVYNCRCTIYQNVVGFKSVLPAEKLEDYMTGEIKVIGTLKSKDTIDLTGIKLYYGIGYDNGLTKAQESAVKAFEEAHYGDFEESILILDKNGKVLATRGGKYGRVSIPKSEYYKAQVLTHTHFRAPIAERGMIGGTFSGTDMFSFVQSEEMKVMRAVAPEGTYIIIKNEDFKASDFNSFIQDKYSKMKARYTSNLDFLSQSEKSKASNNFLILMHNVYREKAKEYGYTYYLKKGKIT